MVLADFGVGQVLWSIIWFTLFFMWIMLVVNIFMDIMRSDMGGGSKALWTIFIIFLPFLGVLLYLVVHGGDMGRRSQQQMAEADAAQKAYIREAAGTQSAADELAGLAQLHESGKLTDEEYAAAKAKVIS